MCIDLRLDQPTLRVVAGQTPRPLKDGQGPIRIGVAPYRDLHLMEPVGVLWDLQAQALIPHGVVLGHNPRLLHPQDFREVRPDPWDEGGARLCGPPLNRALWCGRKRSVRYRLAAALSVIPASANSLGRRSCRVRKARSERPRASGE